MAGDKLYIGAMLAALQTKIDAMTTAMATQTTQLTAINASVGQTVIAGNIVAGDTSVIPTVHGLTTAEGAGYTQVAKIKVFANGKIRVGAYVYALTVGQSANLYYSLDGGTTKVLVGGNTTATPTKKTIDINITALQEITFLINSNATPGGACVANSCFVSYNQINLVVDGFAKQSA